MRKIEVRITENGKVILDFDGYVGEECYIDRDRLIQLLKQHFGINVTVEVDRPKPEAFLKQREESKTEQKVRLVV